LLQDFAPKSHAGAADRLDLLIFALLEVAQIVGAQTLQTGNPNLAILQDARERREEIAGKLLWGVSCRM